MVAEPIGLRQGFAAYSTAMNRCEGMLEYPLGLLKEVGVGWIDGGDRGEYAS